ncbi:MAG: GNAT family N-acetyltransferase, partial [Spirochaetales bacterium]|nr:GNAT family N-acetyltransferase [Spirochaetales bacterium]
MLRLVTPAEEYLTSYYEVCLVTWGHAHNDYIIHNPAEYHTWSKTIFTDYENQRKGIGLPDGYIPSVTYWMVDTDSQQYIGTANIRLQLTKQLADYGGHIGCIIRNDMRGQGFGHKILDLSLDAARRLGISPILYTCILSNESSHSILLSGSYIRKEYDETTADGVFCKVGRFWY